MALLVGCPALPICMNKLYVGFAKEISLPEDGGYLLIDDEVQELPYSRVFNPLKHSLNPLKDITYRRAREIADIIYTVYPQGENTLTVRNGKRELPATYFMKNAIAFEMCVSIVRGRKPDL